MIYLDHASTTPIDKQVLKAMQSFNTKNFGNPSALYKIGRQAAHTINQSKQTISKILNCQPEEVIFTAGGTESDNLAILGVANRFIRQAKDYHLITSNIEHSAVLNTFKALEQQGFQVTYLAVDKFGLINPQDVMKSLKPNTLLVSIMYANNEIGTIQPIQVIAQIIKNYRHIQRVDTQSKNPTYPIFHTDACQAAGYLDLDIKKLGVDLMTLNGSKIYGPKQIGVLYKNKEVKLEPVLYGGSQEQNIRPGTQNVAGIVGFTQALKLADQNKNKETRRLERLRHYFTKKLLDIPETILNGHPTKRLPNNINVTFKRIEGESIMLKLDAQDIYVSTGSACHSLSLDPSHVILAIGQDAGNVHGSMRFTMGKTTTKQELDKVLKVLPKIVQDLKDMTAIKK